MPDSADCDARCVEVLLAILRATDDPEQPGETQRLADVSQIAIEALVEMGHQFDGSGDV